MEKKISQKVLNDKVRAKYLAIIKESLEQLEEEIVVTGSNEYSVPCLDESGNDSCAVIKVSVPTGSRDGEAYDPYAIAEEYKAKITEKAEKEKAKAEAKAKKIAKDKANREKLAQSKALYNK